MEGGPGGGGGGGGVAHLHARVKIHAKEACGHCAQQQSEGCNSHDQLDADDSVSSGIQLHRPQVPGRFQILDCLLHTT